MMDPRASLSCSNSVLSALSGPDRDRLGAHLKPVKLKQGDFLYHAGQKIERVYFPASCLISVLAELSNGYSVELMQVGNHGVVGAFLALGSPQLPYSAVVCVTGAACQISVQAFVNEFKSEWAFQAEVSNSLRWQLSAVAQNVVCAQMHTIVQRMATLLLRIDDSVRGAEFPMTHEFIGNLLGSSRPEVAKAAHNFRAAGRIQYTRGNIKIVDRSGLEKVACECYRTIRELQDNR
jgi:CRP-like cAMP-binding protein